MSQERTVEAPLSSSLAEILQKQGKFLEQIAADQDRPLTLKELPHVREGAKLSWTEFDSKEVARLIGWPTRHTWAGKPSVRFASGDRGDIEFYEKAVEPSGVIADGQRGLNNFWAILHTHPYAFDGVTPATSREIAYAPMPALIRAWTAFPAFMEALQRDLKEVGQIYRMEEALTEQIEAEETNLLRASRLAYGLLARLVRSDDHATHAVLQDSMFPELDTAAPARHFTPITDPSVELWT